MTLQNIHHVRAFCRSLEDRTSTNLAFHGLAMLARNTCANKLVKEIGDTVAHQKRNQGETHSVLKEISKRMKMKRAYPRRNRSFLKIPTELYADGLEQLELMERQEQHDWEFVRETIALLKYSYCEDRGHYRLVDKSEREGLGYIAYFFNEILLANKFILQTITLEEITEEFIVWMQSYGSQQLSDDSALRLALHIAVCLHGTNVITTLHGDVTLVLTDNEDRLKKRTLGINGWIRSGARLPDIRSNGKLSCTWNTIALITSQIESSRARCDLHIDSGLEINRENFLIAVTHK